MKAIETAAYFLSTINKEKYETYNDGISNLKMQKLLFYTQKTYISVYGEVFFNDEIEAWEHGPVVGSVYHKLKRFGKANIDIFDDEVVKIMSECRHVGEQKALILDFIMDKYMPYEAWALRDMTHLEPEWEQSYTPPFNSFIRVSDMKSEELKREFNRYKALVESLNDI